jgi:hypothetical protein
LGGTAVAEGDERRRAGVDGHDAALLHGSMEEMHRAKGFRMRRGS